MDEHAEPGLAPPGHPAILVRQASPCSALVACDVWAQPAMAAASNDRMRSEPFRWIVVVFYEHAALREEGSNQIPRPSGQRAIHDDAGSPRRVNGRSGLSPASSKSGHAAQCQEPGRSLPVRTGEKTRANDVSPCHPCHLEHSDAPAWHAARTGVSIVGQCGPGEAGRGAGEIRRT